MKLLFDQNLSPKLVDRLADIFPDSCHVLELGLDCSSDLVVWNYARSHDFVIVTKDADYNNMGVVMGFPPKVIWLLIGNCATDDIERLLRVSQLNLEQFGQDSIAGTIGLR